MSTPDYDRAEGTTRADIQHWVRSFVWAGEYIEEEIPLLIEDNLCVGDKVDEDWLRDLIRTEIAAKRQEEQTWPAVTDCDRLDRVFAALEAQGMIALQMAGFTQSDGLEEVEDTYNDNREDGEAPEYTGHCFFTTQDQKGALERSGMYIGFGHLSGDDARGVAVGHRLRAALEAEGFSVEWDGTIQSRILVQGFRWQRRTP